MERQIAKCVWKEATEMVSVFVPEDKSLECEYCTGHDIDCEYYTKGCGVVRE